MSRIAVKLGPRQAALAGLALAALACGGSAPVVLSHGSIAVSFETEETCGFEDPFIADATGCRVIDRKALVCAEFGIIDGVLFAAGCEAPAKANILETRGTVPLAASAAGGPAAEPRAGESVRRRRGTHRVGKPIQPAVAMHGQAG